jgi:hypothetical protein
MLGFMVENQKRAKSKKISKKSWHPFYYGNIFSVVAVG